MSFLNSLFKVSFLLHRELSFVYQITFENSKSKQTNIKGYILRKKQVLSTGFKDFCNTNQTQIWHRKVKKYESKS